MPVVVKMPQLGESVEEATVSRWLKSVGDPIDEYEALLEVNTDKVDSEIPSPVSGVVSEILVQPGTTVHIGAPLAAITPINEPSKSAAANPDAQLEARPSPSEDTATATRPDASIPQPPAGLQVGRNNELGFISPLVARMAAEHSISLAQVTGSGAGGRITKKDILRFIEVRPHQSAPSVPPPTPAVPAATLAATGKVIPLNNVRRAIAEHMVMSKRTSPHVTTVMEVDLSQVVAHREANKAAFARDGANLTYTAYFIAATVASLQAYPIVNSSWSEPGIVLHRSIHIGMATSLGEEGLIVPVIKNADSLSLMGLARTINDLATRARTRKLLPDEVKGGTFTITNHGISGSLFASPIINQPQCGILGVGAIQKRVVVVSFPGHGDTIAIRPMAYLSLTFDHRILDGAVADYFLAKVVESLQKEQK